MDTLEQFAKCGWCTEFFDDSSHRPLSLSCGHALCKACIDKNWEGSASNRTINCRTCYKQTSNAQDLIVNQEVLRFANHIRQTRDEQQRYSIRDNSSPKCPQCSKPAAPADMRVCTDCETNNVACISCAPTAHRGHNLTSAQEFEEMNNRLQMRISTLVESSIKEQSEAQGVEPTAPPMYPMLFPEEEVQKAVAEEIASFPRAAAESPAMKAVISSVQWAGQKYFEALIYAHTQAVVYTGRKILPGIVGGAAMAFFFPTLTTLSVIGGGAMYAYNYYNSGR